VGLRSPEKHAFLSAVVALALIIVPASAMMATTVPDWSEKILPFFSLTLAPGVLISLALGGNIHDDLRPLILASSFAFWMAMSYALLYLGKRRTERRKP